MNQSRIIGLIALFVILFSLCYANYIIEKNNYIPVTDMLENPAKYENTEVIVEGIARNVKIYDTIIIFEVVERDELFFSVRQDPSIPEEVPGDGDFVSVKGIFHSPNKIIASYVYSRTMWETALIYIRSVPALVIIILRFLKYWKFTFGGWRPIEDYSSNIAKKGEDDEVGF